MKSNPNWLQTFKRDKYSQTGEDGIIERILDTIPNKDNWCVEFGAWDGLFLTSTRNLIESRNYSAVLIEGDVSKFDELHKNYLGNPGVTPIKRMVGFTDADNLDVILKETPIPIDFDFLSIDIDGNDYHAWKAISHYRPKLVVIEYNPTIPTHIRFVQPANHTVNQGASLRSLVDLGKEKEYELVSVLRHNAFFVKMEYFPLFEIESNDPETLRTETDAITYIFTGYDGTIFLRGNCTLPWHGVEIEESNLQYLPKYLRRQPTEYSWTQQRIFNFRYRKSRLRKLVDVFTHPLRSLRLK